jgi:ABC-type bacteriocin/lantibiotic exporter with double-glycine peptidase domain
MGQNSSVLPRARLLELLRAESGDLWVVAVFSVAIGLLSLSVPVATQALVNTVAFGNLLQPMLILSLLVVCVLGVSAVLQLLRFRAVEYLQRRVFVRLASESVNRLLRARADELRLQNGPEVVNRFLDVVTVQKAGATLLVDGLSVTMQTAMGMALLAVYHPWLLVFDVFILAALLVVVFPLGSGAVPTAIGESKAKYALVGWLEEIARNVTTFRGEAQTRFAFQRCDALVQEYLGYRSSHFRIVVRQFAGSLALQAAASAALLGVGGMLVIQRQLTLGQLVAAELVVAAVLSGITKFAKHLETFYDLMAALDKLGVLTGLAVEQSGDEPVPPGPGAAQLVVRSGSHTLAVAAGEKVGLIGSSGAGKSTLLDTICGYGPPLGGTVELDGCDLRSLRLHELRSQIALVRGVEIFHGSVLDNVRVGRELSSPDVQKALAKVGIWGAIQQLPDGLASILATGGAPLSTGQQQALMFARAIVGQPRLLLVDEALDLVQDAEDREALTSLLFGASAPWTLILVTSRPELLRRCTRVLRLNADGLREAA